MIECKKREIGKTKRREKDKEKERRKRERTMKQLYFL